MDYLTFTTKIVDALAWPVSVLIIAILCRNQLSDLFQRITKGKIAGNEFEFSESAQQQLVTAEDQITPPNLEDEYDSDSSDAENDLDTAYQLLETSPRAAVAEAWRHLYRAAIERISSFVEDESSESSMSSESLSYRDDYATRRLPPARVTAYLRQFSILSSDEIALFEELRRLRNQSVHASDFEIGEKKAKEYLILTELLMEKL